ncbi:LysM peptidoglycan-binding domain-containing protein [Flavobacterium cerinum]|uniref:LysM peptidoglycan-binding domain-containing protein n=1 Tax=Flavobacterium cerinum TaxID=2502784 RepID=A0ABY5IR75_9FLAO|nr:LysM peptidoglycan-binding domain-containing protein [Flavobacterium cerinum]UUC44283.1 LysM peptidoglycan-binding domain-containing protein [Flavobacterium cerinum]
MKHFVTVVISGLFLSNVAFAQTKNYIEHKVEKGETVVQIAKKYSVTPYDIYRMNPDSQNGLKENTKILVPTSSGKIVSTKTEDKKAPVKEALKEKVKEAVAYKTISHTVEAKEGVYGIAKKYGTTIEAIYKSNPTVEKEGLKIGQVLTINVPKTEKEPVKNSVQEVKQSLAATTGKTLYHIVEPKETKFGIAKKYGLSVQELEDLNPAIKENLEIGYNLRLSKNVPAVQKTVEKEIEKVAENNKYISYEVKPKETMYRLTKSSGLSQEQLIVLNPELKEGVKAGMVLKLPNTSRFDDVKGNKTSVDILKTIKKEGEKELVLFMPFNLDRIASDSIRSTQERLRSDKFLNMTLDFYAGALMAIDSARALGLPVKVRIFDSKETKNNSAVAAIIDKNNFSNTDAVIGPFFQSNVENTANLLSQYNTPVISPLSNEKGKPYSNLFQSMPNSDDVKRKMFDYMQSKNGNIIAIVDPKKGSSRQYLKENYPSVKLAELNEKGSVTLENIKSLMEADKVNFVILETESKTLVLNSLNILVSALSQFQVQLVTLEKNETLDFEEIPLSRLTKLKLLYPSVTKDNETPEALVFATTFKKKNNIFPNRFATRGFDVTFDVIVRMFQENGFKESITETASEQVENKFDYVGLGGGYYNTGVYIMNYNDDLTVKEAK